MHSARSRSASQSPCDVDPARAAMAEDQSNQTALCSGRSISTSTTVDITLPCMYYSRAQFSSILSPRHYKYRI